MYEVALNMKLINIYDKLSNYIPCELRGRVQGLWDVSDVNKWKVTQDEHYEAITFSYDTRNIYNKISLQFDPKPNWS